MSMRDNSPQGQRNRQKIVNEALENWKKEQKQTTMRKLHEEIQDHIHQETASEVNQEIIHIKLHHMDISNQSQEQKDKIIEARNRVPEPSWERMIDLLERVHLELITCKQPFRKR